MYSTALPNENRSQRKPFQTPKLNFTTSLLYSSYKSKWLTFYIWYTNAWDFRVTNVLVSSLCSLVALIHELLLLLLPLSLLMFLLLFLLPVKIVITRFIVRASKLMKCYIVLFVVVIVILHALPHTWMLLLRLLYFYSLGKKIVV